MSIAGGPLQDDRPRSPLVALLARFEHARVARGDALDFVALGSVVLFLMACEAITGVLLALYYRPAIGEANASVRFIVTEVEYGALVRGLHVACAHLLIVVLIAAIAWALVRRAYRAPHGLAWSCGVALLLIQSVEAFTGRMLPWTRASVVDAEISAALIGQLPGIGPGSRAIMLGANRTGDLALVRILGVHAGLLPIAATAIAGLLLLHFAGSLSKRSAAAESELPLVPDVALRIAAICASIAIALLVSLSLWSPELGPAAETTGGTAHAIRPSWFMLVAHRLLRVASGTILGLPGARVVGVVFALVALFAMVFPALDRKGSRIGQAVGLIVMAAFIEETLRALLG